MDGFFANNWFSILTVLAFIGTALINWGVSKQRGSQTQGAVEKLERVMTSSMDKLDRDVRHELDSLQAGRLANAQAIQSHINNSDAHVTSTFLELLKTRHDFMIQQISDSRVDIQRIEQMLSKIRSDD